jgi:ABC-type Mn2+/Zn2+ transport system permease subunit
VNPFLSAIVFCLLTAWGIGWASTEGEIKEDTAIGIFFASTMALGVLFIGLMKAYNVDLFGYLFGSVLAVTEQDIWLSLIVGGVVLLAVVLLYKELKFVTFDQEMAEVVGLPATFLYFLLLSLMALTVVISIKVVGVILVSALLVIPPATAYQVSDDFGRMMFLSIAVGVGSAVIGLFLSYWLDVASGATIVLTATTLFFLAALLSPRRRMLRRRQLALIEEIRKSS